METTTTTFTYVPPSQQLPAQTQMISEAALNDAYGLAISAILLRVFCLLGCLAVLIPASLATSAINDVEGAYDYEHAVDYRIAAVFLVSLAALSIVYNGVAIVVWIICFKCNMGKHFDRYSIANTVLSILFGLAFLYGGEANLEYSSDNRDLYNDLGCEPYFDNQYEFCDDLETVYASEIAAAMFALFSVGMFISLFVVSHISSYSVQKMQEASNMRSVPTTYSYSPLQ